MALTETQKYELLSYHRTIAKRDKRCPNCNDELRKMVHTCYWCGSEYSDERGIVLSGRDAVNDIRQIMGKKLTPEERSAAVEARLKRSMEHGVAVGGSPEGDRVLAELQARRMAAGKSKDDTPGMGDTP